MEVTDETRAAISNAIRAVLVSAIVLTLVGWLAFDAHIGISVMIGGLLASLNLIVFARLVRAFLTGGGNTAPWGVLGALKLVGLFACVYILIKRAGVSPLGLAMGYAALPVGIMFGSLSRGTPHPPAKP
jgi:hypothetical protein